MADTKYAYGVETFNGGMMLDRAAISRESAKQAQLKGAGSAFRWRTNVDPSSIHRTPEAALQAFAEGCEVEAAHLEKRIAQLREWAAKAKAGDVKRSWTDDANATQDGEPAK